MDGVLADYVAHAEFDENGKFDEPVGFFENLPLIKGAQLAVELLRDDYDCFILTTAPWDCISSLSEKRIWIEKHFGDTFKRKLITTHRKDLLMGDYLIDDRPYAHKNADFKGKLIHFGSDKFKDWKSVVSYLLVY